MQNLLTSYDSNDCIMMQCDVIRVIFAYQTKLNISRKKSATKILPKTLHSHFKLSLQCNQENVEISLHRHFNYNLSGICRDKCSKYIFSPLPINMCSLTTRRAYNFSNINSARAFCQKHRSVYVEIVIR